MTQAISQPPGFAGEVPPNLKCGFCRAPVQAQFYRALNRFACGACAAKMQAMIARNALTPEMLFRAAGLGILTAAACAVAWAATVHATHLELGIVASLIGVAVGKAVYFASGKRRGPALQWLAIALAVLGVVAGKLLLVGWWIADGIRADGQQATLSNIVTELRLRLQVAPATVFRPFDLLWIGIAAYAAWRLCRMPRVTVAGPYPYQPAAGAVMQFRTVEPTSPPGAAGSP